jgi:hypothetical protein
MANVMFKRGLSTALPVGANIIDGAFYLTEDTNHLYIGKQDAEGNKSLAKINGNIHAVNTLPTTGEQGEFYYLPGQNILAYYDTDKWVQLNPDTDTDTIVDSVSVTKNTAKSNATQVVYDLKIGRKDIDGTALTDVATEFVISSDDVTGIVTKTEVDVNATVETNKATIKTNGAGAAGDGLTIVGADGITIGGSADAIEIDGTTYEMSVDGTTIKLTDSDEKAAGSATIVGDDDWTAAANKDGKIEISHKEKTVNAPDAVAGTITDKKFTVVTGITTDKNHVTGIEKSEFTLPNTVYELDSEEGTLTLSDGTTSEKYTTVVKLVDEDGTEDKVDVKTAHKITVDGTERIVKNGGDFGAFYSASEIDGKFKAVDAMVYMGPVPTEGLPTEEVRIGDTYKVTVAGTYAGYEAEVGDIFIARGEEDADGYITGDITWDYIRTGGDTDTTYELSAAGDAIILTGSTGAAGSITLGNTEKIELDATDDKITATHLGAAATQTTETAVEKDFGAAISVVTAVSTDATGHATEVKTQEITLPKADKVVVEANAPKFELQTNAGTKKGSIVIDEKENTPVTVTGTVEGNNLTVTVEHDALTVGTGTDDAQSVALSGEGKFTVISSIENDGFGHLKTVKTKEVTIAKETTYDLTGSVEDKVAKVTLTDSNDVTDVVEFSSETLNYYSTEDNKIKVELEWGTF